MPVYVEGQSVSFSQNSSVDCSCVSSTWFRCPGLFGRTARLTVAVCDELDFFTIEFPFVVQRDKDFNLGRSASNKRIFSSKHHAQAAYQHEYISRRNYILHTLGHHEYNYRR